VHDQAVQALGPEDPEIPPGQYHRAGQPCTVCHGPEGPAQTQFSVAGTIFGNPYIAVGTGPSGSVGYNNAYISIVDDNGQISPAIESNCVGNFWATPAAFNPAFPILVSVYPAGQTTGAQVMYTQIGRSSSCADCHSDPPNYNAVGHVYIDAKGPGAYIGDQSCPADPNLADLETGGLP
jgi:mono/diheme cytochrome c family protein